VGLWQVSGRRQGHRQSHVLPPAGLKISGTARGHDPRAPQPWGDVIERVEGGERLIVTRSGRPVAELRPVQAARECQSALRFAEISVAGTRELRARVLLVRIGVRYFARTQRAKELR
jgi:prevent-host-death family protein